MSQLIAEKRIDWEEKINIAMEVVWLLIIFLVPLYFDRFLFNPWEMAKNILFQSLTEILIALYLIKIVLFPSEIRNFTKIKKFYYLIPGMVFIIILGLSTIFSQVPWFSFWGSWERRMGYLAWLHFFAFGSILFLNLKSQKQIQRITITIVITSAIVVTYGFIQLLGLEPFEWSEEAFYTHRVYSTIGQPNFLGSWLLLIIPLIFYGLIKFKNFLVKFLMVLLLIAALACFVLTQSRGGWIGFVVAIFFFFTILFWLKNKKKIVLVILLLVLLGLSLIIYLNFHPLKINPTDHPLVIRLKTFSDVKVFGKYRLIHWQAAFDIIKNRPLTRILIGSGMGSQRFNLPKYYRPEFAIYEAPNIYLDYVHNDILDTLLTSGVLGLVSYLGLIIISFYLGFKKIRKNIFGLFLLTGLIGYLISLQFSFHIMSTLPYFWLYLGLIFWIHQQKDNEEKKEQNNKIFKIISIILIILITIFTIWWFNLRLYLASHYLLEATLEKIKGNWLSMIKYHNLSVKYQPDNPYFRQQYALALLESTPFQSNIDQAREFFDLGIKQIEAIPAKERPVEARNWIAWLLTEKANLTQEVIDFQKAEKAYQELAEFAPGAALTYGNWCGLKFYEQKWDETIEMCQKAINLYPDLNHPHLNPEHRSKIITEQISVYNKLALTYFRMKDFQTALSYYEKILRLDPNQIGVWFNISQIYYLKKDLETAIAKIYHGYIRQPNNPQWTIILSNLYREKNDLKNANYWAGVAEEIQKQKTGYKIP
ncbi:MAG: O-antigen ligase family protein [Patescibacteria group bacterium]